MNMFFVGLLQTVFIYCHSFVQGLEHIAYGERLKSQDIRPQEQVSLESLVTDRWAVELSVHPYRGGDLPFEGGRLMLT